MWKKVEIGGNRPLAVCALWDTGRAQLQGEAKSGLREWESVAHCEWSRASGATCGAQSVEFKCHRVVLSTQLMRRE